MGSVKQAWLDELGAQKCGNCTHWDEDEQECGVGGEPVGAQDNCSSTDMSYNSFEAKES